MTKVLPKEWQSPICIPPGETLREILHTKRISQAQFARKINRPVPAINEIIKGKKIITPKTAIDFEKALKISATFWLNLESNYRLCLLRKKTSGIK